MHESVQARLARRVVRAHHAAGERCDRRDEQDAAELALDHGGQDLLGKQQRGGEVHREGGVPRPEIDVLPTVEVGLACVGDEQVDLAEFVVGVRDQGGGRLGVGHVGGDDGHPAAQLAGVGGGLLCVVGVAAVGQAQVCALVGQSSCDGLADATGRPGEQRDAALQFVRHGCTRIRIGLPSWRSSFSMPERTSSSETTSLIERDRSSRPADTSVASVPMSAFW